MGQSVSFETTIVCPRLSSRLTDHLPFEPDVSSVSLLDDVRAPPSPYTSAGAGSPSLATDVLCYVLWFLEPDSSDRGLASGRLGIT